MGCSAKLESLACSDALLLLVPAGPDSAEVAPPRVSVELPALPDVTSPLAAVDPVVLGAALETEEVGCPAELESLTCSDALPEVPPPPVVLAPLAAVDPVMPGVPLEAEEMSSPAELVGVVLPLPAAGLAGTEVRLDTVMLPSFSSPLSTDAPSSVALYAATS